MTLQAQAISFKIEQKLSRQQRVVDALKDSPEMKAYVYIREEFWPTLQAGLRELEMRTDDLQSIAMQSNTNLANLFPVSLHRIQLHLRPAEQLKSAREVRIS